MRLLKVRKPTGKSVILDTKPIRPIDLLVGWDCNPIRGLSCNLTYIEWFSAKGMCRAFTREDKFGRQSFRLELWLTDDSRVLARRMARSRHVDDNRCCYEVLGMTLKQIRKMSDLGGHQHWIPWSLRIEYDDWIVSELSSHWNGYVSTEWNCPMRSKVEC
jgi:hypothetical protein